MFTSAVTTALSHFAVRPQEGWVISVFISYLTNCTLVVKFLSIKCFFQTYWRYMYGQSSFSSIPNMFIVSWHVYVCMYVCVCVCVYCLWDSCSPWQNYAVVCLEVQSLLFVDSICYYYDMIKCRPSHRKIHELFEWSAITLLFFTFVFLTYVCTFFLFIPEVSDWSALSAQYWKGALCPSQNNKVLSIMILM